MTGICPYACGFIPQELTCALNEKRDEGLPWWRRLFHCLRGDYFCVTEGTLPCPIMSKCDRKLLAANVPSMAFLASGLWCLKADHPVCAGWLLAFSILTHAWISREERRDD